MSFAQTTQPTEVEEEQDGLPRELQASIFAMLLKYAVYCGLFFATTSVVLVTGAAVSWGAMSILMVSIHSLCHNKKIRSELTEEQSKQYDDQALHREGITAACVISATVLTFIVMTALLSNPVSGLTVMLTAVAALLVGLISTHMTATRSKNSVMNGTGFFSCRQTSNSAEQSDLQAPLLNDDRESASQNKLTS